ncbi:MAG TPA: sel1 repeat family protein [Rhodanobacteraceae bacterium]|nr:sel1 repeat family protein [Rhodanobacteraceae bacterium]
MKTPRLLPWIALCLAAMLAAGCVHLSKDTGDAQVDSTLEAMGKASTWGHPDQFGQFAGMRAYADGDYANAMNQFKNGAWYADKLSQLSLGLMYLNGKGVAADPVEAYAWLAVAAERKYPQFVATRDRVWASLDAAQRQRATVAAQRIQAEYGDQIAKRRMANELNYARTQITGSRTGFVSAGMGHAATRNGCTSSNKLGLPEAGCGSGDIYADWRLIPDLYFQAIDAQWNGSVTVGAVEDVSKPGAKPPQPATAASTH